MTASLFPFSEFHLEANPSQNISSVFTCWWWPIDNNSFAHRNKEDETTEAKAFQDIGMSIDRNHLEYNVVIFIAW